ncbi:MAG: hypothetical protein V3V72_03115 [Ignavibacteriaceae bacterium]
MNFYYTYVLQSLKDHKFYYGFTNNLKLSPPWRMSSIVEEVQAAIVN